MERIETNKARALVFFFSSGCCYLGALTQWYSLKEVALKKHNKTNVLKIAVELGALKSLWFKELLSARQSGSFLCKTLCKRPKVDVYFTHCCKRIHSLLCDQPLF